MALVPGELVGAARRVLKATYVPITGSDAAFPQQRALEKYAYVR